MNSGPPRTRPGAVVLLLLLALACAGTPALAATRMAVLPVEDLSLGDNGLNLPVSARLREALAAKGLEMVSEQDVREFMARNRIRWLGRIDANHAARLGQELRADYLLLGSVSQRRERDPAAMALSLQLVRSGDARLLWTGSAELSRADMRRLLGIAEPQGLAEIEELVVAGALADWPAVLPAAPVGPLQGVAETIHLAPEVVRPGDAVTCRIRLDETGLAAQTTVIVVAGEQIVRAAYLAREQAYEASWPAPAANGRYAVSVSIGRRNQGVKNVFAGSFLVDSTPPEPLLFLRGQELDGAVVLHSQLNITAALRAPEPLSGWEIEILDSGGKPIKAESGRGNLPGRFSWWGQSQDGNPVADGEYAVRLTARDRAGNSAAATEGFLVVRKKPELKLQAARRGEELLLDLSYDGKAPLVYWRLELRTIDQGILFEASGNDLPPTLQARPPEAAGKISALVQGQDALGNRVRQNIDDIFALRTGTAGTEEEVDEQKTGAAAWSVDF